MKQLEFRPWFLSKLDRTLAKLFLPSFLQIQSPSMIRGVVFLHVSLDKDTAVTAGVEFLHRFLPQVIFFRHLVTKKSPTRSGKGIVPLPQNFLRCER